MLLVAVANATSIPEISERKKNLKHSPSLDVRRKLQSVQSKGKQPSSGKGKGKSNKSKGNSNKSKGNSKKNSNKSKGKSKKNVYAYPLSTAAPSAAPSIDRYPYCNVPNRTWIGDGWCHEEPYNTAVCGWDGGDCPIKYPDCDVTFNNYFGDGKCDEIFNNEACGFDDGDCEPDCFGAGNGYCENEFNTVLCDFDGNDCEEFNSKYPSCVVSNPEYVGDDMCDGGSYNTSLCGFDGGDCIENMTSSNSSEIVDSEFSYTKRHLFEIILNYLYPQPEEDQLEWQQ